MRIYLYIYIYTYLPTWIFWGLATSTIYTLESPDVLLKEAPVVEGIFDDIQEETGSHAESLGGSYLQEGFSNWF